MTNQKCFNPIESSDMKFKDITKNIEICQFYMNLYKNCDKKD